MTPHELNLHIEEFQKYEKYQNKERITAAYMGAYFERVKKMPDLQKLLDNEPQEKKKGQSATDMLAEVKRLNAALGGTEF